VFEKRGARQRRGWLVVTACRSVWLHVFNTRCVPCSAARTSYLCTAIKPGYARLYDALLSTRSLDHSSFVDEEKMNKIFIIATVHSAPHAGIKTRLDRIFVVTVQDSTYNADFSWHKASIRPNTKIPVHVEVGQTPSRSQAIDTCVGPNPWLELVHVSSCRQDSRRVCVAMQK